MKKRVAFLSFACCFLLVPAGASAHSVGQVQTTKYFAPETLQMIRDRTLQGGDTLRAGDIVSYIVQFTPVANGATVGAGGYITDYIPLNTEVVGA